MRKLYIVASLLLLGTLPFSGPSFAQTYPAGFAQQRVSGGLAVQTAVAFAPDGRIFVAEQSGRVRIIKNGVTLATPFITLTVDSRGERGLVGIAVDPEFLTNKWIYVYYTVPGTPARNRVSRFTATNDVVTGGETVILSLEALSNSFIHNGGALRFGPDGKLYIAVGENANTQSAQNLDSYNGKLLRINKDGSVPPGNPFTTGSEQRRRVWAYGLRNPFTFSIDHETGKIFINDVGQALWEEVNDATVGGRNFGWPMTEGRFTQTSFPTLTNPIYAYPHPPGGGSTGDGNGCAIVGGTFISPSNTNYPAQYRGKYFFQENCGNWINMLDVSTGTAVRTPFATGVIANSLGLTMGIDGLMYFCARHGESLYRIVYNNTSVPSITNHPVNSSVAVGQPASFTVSALGTPPLAYQWLKNDLPIAGATSATYSIPQTTLTHQGSYKVRVSNSSGNVTSNAATLTVINNLLPVAEILTPVAGTTYVAGATTISFSGKGTDPEQGALPASSMSWGINFHHDTHHHDQPPINGIASGTFSVPDEGETSSNVWYRIVLTVTDNLGLKAKDSVDIHPMKSTLSFATNPPGLQITLDGQPFNTPGSVVSVEGIKRSLGVISPQTVNNQTYEFSSWSNGGTQTQTITTPTADAAYTANFVISQRSFYRAINLNGPALTIDGNNWQASAGAANFSFTGATFANQGVALTPPTDANRANMIRSSIWYHPAITISAVPQGTYEVWLYAWEDNFPVTYSISMEGTVVQSNVNSGAAGTWKKLGPFTAAITDGTINVNAIGLEANISGIEIWSLVQPDSGPSLTNPLVDQTAVAGTAFTYAFAANTFTPEEPAGTLTYSATLANDAPLPAWLLFNAATRTFSGTPAVANAGAMDIKVTATEGTESATDIFRLTVNSLRITNLLVDQTATVGSAFNYTFALNSFSPGLPGAALTYGATLANDTPLPSWLIFSPSTRAFSGTPAGTNVGVIDIKVTAREGTVSVNDIFRLTVNAVPTSAFYRAVNINGPALLIDGNNWQASAGAPNFSFIGAAFANQNVTLAPATDANRANMIRSGIWYHPQVTLSAVPTGTYQIYVYVWEDNFPVSYSIALEGAVVQSNYNSGSAGAWARLGPFSTTITDGTINVNAIGLEANFSGIEVWTGSGGGQSAARYATDNSQEAAGHAGDSDLISFPNPFSDKVTIGFTASRAARTTISVYDVRGVKVYSLFDAAVPSGHRGELALEPTNLPNGVYILEMINGQDTKRLKMMLAR
jgi:glucose/arabinose dehydrogenase